jgi:hypothetical protein
VVGIERLIKAKQPAGGSHRDATFADNAAIVYRLDSVGNAHYYVVNADDEDEGNGSEERRVYVNSRPNCPGTQAKWYLSQTTMKMKDMHISTKFRFEIHHKTGHKVIPTVVRRKFRLIPALFGKQGSGEGRVSM